MKSILTIATKLASTGNYQTEKLWVSHFQLAVNVRLLFGVSTR